MKKFMAIYMAPATLIAEAMKATPAEMKAGMDEWYKWSDDNESVMVDLGTPLGKTKRVSAAGASDSKNEMTGYSIVEGDSLEAVAKLFTNHPHLKMGEAATIDIMECVAIPGMGA